MEAASPGAGFEDLISNYKELQKHHQRLQPAIDDIMCQIASCNADMEYSEKIKKGEQFTSSKKEIKIIKVPLQPKEYTTNCDACQTTCHYPCGIDNNDDKIKCSAMLGGMCKECKCPWTRHVNNNFRYEYQECDVRNTMDDLLKKYKLDSNSDGAIEGVIQRRTQQLQQKLSVLMGQMEFVDTNMQKNSAQLKHVAQTFDTKIAIEMRNKRPGYLDRIKVLEQQKKRATDYS